MKKILSISALSMLVIFTACKSDKSTAENIKVVYVQDTSHLYDNDYLTDKIQDGQVTGVYAGSAFKSIPVKTQVKPVKVSNAAANNQPVVNSGSNTAATTPATTKKKGWSHKAKGVAVGAGTGAITGALINKDNRGVGAIVGGLVGAASGYIIGNEVDKKKERNRP